MEIHSADIEPSPSGHLLIVNGQAAARFNDLANAVGARDLILQERSIESQAIADRFSVSGNTPESEVEVDVEVESSEDQWRLISSGYSLAEFASFDEAMQAQEILLGSN